MSHFPQKKHDKLSDKFPNPEDATIQALYDHIQDTVNDPKNKPPNALAVLDKKGTWHVFPTVTDACPVDVSKTDPPTHENILYGQCRNPHTYYIGGTPYKIC